MRALCLRANRRHFSGGMAITAVAMMAHERGSPDAQFLRACFDSLRPSTRNLPPSRGPQRLSVSGGVDGERPGRGQP